MRLVYSVNGRKKSTRISNQDVIITRVKNGSHIQYIIEAINKIELIKATNTCHLKPNLKDLYFFNGYQSWTDSREVKITHIDRNIYTIPTLIRKQYAMHAYGDGTFYKYHELRLHGYDLFYSKGKCQAFSYSLNYKNAFLVYEMRKELKKMILVSMIKGIVLNPGEMFVIFDYKWFDSYEEGLKEFEIDFPSLNKEKIFGYTSWYNYYQDINESIILRDLDAIDSRFNLFQIDDGYETFVGDWLDVDNKKFPNGLKPIVDKIHDKGLKAGLWLAPFAVETNSKLFKEHKELLKKDKYGNPVKGGGNWSHFYSLDLENEEAWKYIEKCLKHYVDLGFDFFKLDFLYAASLPLYKGHSRAEIAYKSYSRLREILKGKIILGCGATLFSCKNNFDYCRIGPDVSLEYDDVWFMRRMHRERVSTKTTLQNTIYRSLLNNRLFGNDPDVFLLRDDNIKMNDKQKEALIMINALFGNIMMTSDNIANYTEKQQSLLKRALDIYLNARNISFIKESKNTIKVYYTLNDDECNFVFNIKKGEIIHG